ncbi:helix-turn-helix domain-containing protein [Nodosilinea sp. FACHB-13]|uniref:helix-turn-helix domain-containing protein n=1 Tax=Cyanophyceae TaxID=3028117 RepID=UPI00168870E0|nr:helix-turn-helix domain-containing protein [Nodosilinea sp. FACHB-13]MBD2110062.1 helix-turn-helix domain-containing protein [Nodosilinea sp. FACHB-13]
MAGVLRIGVEESVETLKTLLDEQRDAVSRSKVQVLWWIKTGQLSSVNALAQMSGYHRTTVSRWLSAYRQGGLEVLLAVQPKPGRPPKIRGAIRQRLERELQDPEGFGSYKEVQHWLQAVCGVKVAYKTVHGTVRYRLKAKLKRPRPVSPKQAPGAVEAFKKTLD